MRTLQVGTFRLPWDYAGVLAVLVTAHLTVGGFLARSEKIRSFETVSAQARALPESEVLDLVMLGDSRSELLDVGKLGGSLGLRPSACFNASMNSGSWVGAFSTLRGLGSRVGRGTVVLLCVSDYWLEMPAYEESTGVYPGCEDYWLLGRPVDAATSHLPLSAFRGVIVERVRKRGETRVGRWERTLRGKREAPVPAAAVPSLPPSNVDLWFSPIEEDQRRDNREFAEKVLLLMKQRAPGLVLVNLPNASARERYVEERHPGRRERFQEAVAALSAGFGIPNLNLAGTLPDDRLYQDFHHWNGEGRQAGAEILAERLRPWVEDIRKRGSP